MGAGQAASIARGSDSPRIEIDLARGTPREQLAKQTLEQVLASHDLRKYTFTRKVVIEQGAINHAFPVLTLNAYFASSPDELLSTYIHEQLHWHLRNRAAQQQAAITELRRLYPRVPVGLPASAENEYSTYGHLVDCYLEILADRELLGAERTAIVIHASRGTRGSTPPCLRTRSRLPASSIATSCVCRDHLHTLKRVRSVCSRASAFAVLSACDAALQEFRVAIREG